MLHNSLHIYYHLKHITYVILRSLIYPIVYYASVCKPPSNNGSVFLGRHLCVPLTSNSLCYDSRNV